jgi:hypothetical protein
MAIFRYEVEKLTLLPPFNTKTSNSESSSHFRKGLISSLGMAQLLQLDCKIYEGIKILLYQSLSTRISFFGKNFSQKTKVYGN